MSTSNDRDRYLLTGIEQQLKREDPTWARDFTDLQPTRQTDRSVLLETLLGLSILLTAVGVVFGSLQVVAIFGAAAVMLTVERHLQRAESRRGAAQRRPNPPSPR